MKGLSIFLIVVVGIAVAAFILWLRVPSMLAETASKKLGVGVSIGSMGLTPSNISVSNIEIANIPKSILPKAFSCGSLNVSAPLTNYLKDDIVVDEISLDRVYLGLEFKNSKGATGNWTQIMGNLQKTMAAEKPASPKEKTTTLLIKKLILTNINTDVVYVEEGGKVIHLPMIASIELNNISSEGAFPIDQLMGSVLGQMLKQVFIKQNLQNMVQDVMQDFLKNPQGTVDKYLQPFKRFIPARDTSQDSDQKSA